MNAAIGALLGALMGLGVWLVVAGLAGSPLLPQRTGRLPAWSRTTIPGRRVGAAVAAGASAWLVTAWPAAGVAVAVGWAAFAGRLGGDLRRVSELNDAVAGWCEMLTSTMAAGAAPEQAIDVTVDLAPPAIAGPVRDLAARLRYQPLSVAMAGFADDVDHPAADKVAVSLAVAGDHGVRDLSALLRAQVASIRQEGRLLVEIEAGRAKHRTALRMIVGITLVFVVGLRWIDDGFLDVYDTAGGQAVLALVAAMYLSGLALMVRLLRIRTHPRFFGAPAAGSGAVSALAPAGAGALVAVGVWLTGRGLLRRPAPLAVELDRFARPATATADDWPDGAAWKRRLAGTARPLLDDVAWLRPDPADLAVIERSAAEHAYQQVAGTLAGAAGPIVVTATGSLVGVSLPAVVLVVGVPVMAAVGLGAPNIEVAKKATARRDDLRHALSAYLDLVRILVAGGTHPDGALIAAAERGHGQAFRGLAEAMAWTRTHAAPPAVGLQRLGERLGLVELVELAATVGLADTQGSSPREALVAKAESMRALELAETRAAAERVGETLTVPGVIMAFGFVAGLMFPALWNLTQIT